MKLLKATISFSQIKAILHKDLLVRWRQKWLLALQLLLPMAVYLLPILIRLKFSAVPHEACQFPTRQFPTAHNTLPGFLSYICTLENKCKSTQDYEEYEYLTKAPLKPVLDIVQIAINEDSIYKAFIELPEKANFISAMTSMVTNSHFGEIRKNIEKVIAMVPDVEKALNGSFNIKQLFSDRNTLSQSGTLLCGYPFPRVQSIPLINEILSSEDFSKTNEDELSVMPTPYCKQLYLDVTSTNFGKITWETVKPIIIGKILYAPNTPETYSIMKHSNSTFEELERVKQLSIALEQILIKVRQPGPFLDSVNSLLKLVQTPFVRSIVGDDFDLDQVEGLVNRFRTDPLIFDVISTVKNILECFSVDRFEAYDTETELRKKAFELNQRRLFYAAVYFNETEGDNISYKIHMDTQNTQPTIENRNRFWFPGPSGSMLLDMKYHRGFAQIKQALDLGIIRHKKQQLRDLGIVTDRIPTGPTRRPFSIEIDTGSGSAIALNGEDDDDDDWFTDSDSSTPAVASTTSKSLISSFVSGLADVSRNASKYVYNATIGETTTNAPSSIATTESSTDDSKAEEEMFTTPSPVLDDALKSIPTSEDILHRAKRQGLFGALSAIGRSAVTFEVDELKFYSKQFPYPAYTEDRYRTGIYLGQAVQVGFFLGLMVQIAACVRHLIWTRESKNSMIMRSMGLRPFSEMASWCTVTFGELVIIFVLSSIALYVGDMLIYTKWLFAMIYLCIFGSCLIAFCFMCSTFFSSATIGAVATSVLFFISFCPYIIVLMFDAQLNSLQNFLINLSFSTAFANGWSHIMRMEIQEVGLTFQEVFREGLRGQYSFSVFMIVFDLCLYAFIGYVHQRFKDDEHRFVEVQREDLDESVGATLTNVTKIYNEDKYALSDVSLSFPRNKVTCLLGRNGAGKSTIIKLLTGQIVQTTGRVILSQNMSSGRKYDRVGVCSQDNILIPNLTAREHLTMYAKIKLKRDFEAEVAKTLQDLNFGKHENYEAGQLSGGYQRRLCVAIAFIGSPNVVILDEPCNGVDNKARKDIWDLIERLRKGRAVVFATHFLDEAEHLSDVIVIMKSGKIVAKHNPETLKNHCTAFYEVSMQSCDSQTSEEILGKADKLLSNFRQLDKTSSTDLKLRISYDQQNYNSSDYLQYLQQLQREGRVKDLSIESENLEQVFKNTDKHSSNGSMPSNGHQANGQSKKPLSANAVRDEPLGRCEAMSQLFRKRFIHFSRNYRALLCVLVLPAIFELCAMWFVAQRLEDDYDKTIKFSRELYPKTTQLLSMQLPQNFTADTYGGMKRDCPGAADLTCKEFPDTKRSFYWLLETLNDYREKRYGGFSFNDSRAMVWYNNKGYHAMMAWMNDLNSYLMQAETNNSNYRISSYNEPWELGYTELSTTSILRQAGDSAMAFVLLIGFSMVVSVASVYLVNERVKGEKLQQRLCGVDAATYWLVAFVWDFLVLIVGIVICCAVILMFNMPVFTDRQQLWGVIVLALFYGFAVIPGIHVFEKLFSESSVAIVGIFNMNVVIPLVTMAMNVLLGVVGDSPVWDDWRHFLNHRLFMVFPQHALGDGFLELCKNYMAALTFTRYDIDSYKNPVASDLLQTHLISLVVMGIVFSIVNILLESGLIGQWQHKAFKLLGFYDKNIKHIEELNIISIQNALKGSDKMETPALKVENLCKSYQRNQFAVANVTFSVKAGECLGLLGKNGAGKSTIFKMLSGQLRPDMGTITYECPEISYCPQTNILDDLLTVRESIEFYGRLRRISDIPKLIDNILESYQLEAYRDVLVKNLSGGNRRKLTVATACCGRTSVVLMDEPTSDMDPVTRAFVYRSIDELLHERRAIVLTSHSISEIDAICHRIAVLKDGQLLTCNSPDALKAQYGGYYNVTVYCDQSKLKDLEREIHRKFPNAENVQTYAHSITFSKRIDNPMTADGHKENGITATYSLPSHTDSNNSTSSMTPADKLYTLSQLFLDLSMMTQQVTSSARFAVSKCKLDAVFETILDRSEQDQRTNGLVHKSPALQGTASTGYIHNGYVETET